MTVLKGLASFLAQIGGVGPSGTVLASDPSSASGLSFVQEGLAISGYASARWYTGMSGSSYSTGALASGGTTLYLSPMYIAKRSVWTDIGIWVTATGTATAFHLGIYSGTVAAGNQLSLVSGTDQTVSSVTAAAMNSSTFAAPVTLNKGWYALAVFPNGSLTANVIASGLASYMLGAQDLNTPSCKLGLLGQTYGALASTVTPVITNENSGTTLIGLKSQ